MAPTTTTDATSTQPLDEGLARLGQALSGLVGDLQGLQQQMQQAGGARPPGTAPAGRLPMGASDPLSLVNDALRNLKGLAGTLHTAAAAITPSHAQLSAALSGIEGAASGLAGSVATQAEGWVKARAAVAVDDARFRQLLTFADQAAAAGEAVAARLTPAAMEAVGQWPQLALGMPANDAAALRAALVPSLKTIQQKVEALLSPHMPSTFAGLAGLVAPLEAVAGALPDAVFAALARLVPAQRLTALASQVASISVSPLPQATEGEGGGGTHSVAKRNLIIVAASLDALRALVDLAGEVFPFSVHLAVDGEVALKPGVGLGAAAALYARVGLGTTAGLGVGLGIAPLSLGALLTAPISALLDIASFVLVEIVAGMVL